jgi:hypothetical protein
MRQTAGAQCDRDGQTPHGFDSIIFGVNDGNRAVWLTEAED